MKGCARAMLAPPRTIWGSYLELGDRQEEGLAEARRLETGWGSGGENAGLRPQDAGIARRTREQRRSKEAPRQTHFLTQVKEHPEDPKKTTPEVKARKEKLVLSLQSRVPAALASSRRPDNRRRLVASGAPRDTSGVALVQRGVMRLRRRRRSPTNLAAGSNPWLGLGAFILDLSVLH